MLSAEDVVKKIYLYSDDDEATVSRWLPSLSMKTGNRGKVSLALSKGKKNPALPAPIKLTNLPAVSKAGVNNATPINLLSFCQIQIISPYVCTQPWLCKWETNKLCTIPAIPC